MKPIEKQLLRLFAHLTQAQQQTLLSFAAFLAASGDNVHSSDIKVVSQPQLLERPATESVVAAIKRLRASYPMVEREKIFDEVARLMTQHVMQGHDASGVIDELEILFCRYYEQLINDNQ
ncbi:MAG: Crp/Fnr family transcriptional regulator [Gammaproteobacteria bacterium]|nr:Crp/Fnr family transcriptional regulator [Gammaproteobacteria bacterium]